MRNSANNVLRAFLLGLGEDSFGGLQVSDAVRHIAFRRLRADLGPERCPNLHAPLTHGAGKDVHAALAGWNPDEMRLALVEGSRAVRAACSTGAARGLAVAPGHVSEKVATRIGRLAVEGLLPLTADRLMTLVDEVLPDPSRPMSAKAFGTAYADLFSQTWTLQGAQSLAAWPPETYDLGHNQAPPLLPGRAAEDTWAVGTDRSVFGRYRLHFKATAQSRTVTCLHERCRSVKAVAPEDAGAHTVTTACSGLGLAHHQHRVVMASIHQGLGSAAHLGADRQTWAEWAADDDEVTSDDAGMDLALVAGVSAHLEAWRSGDACYHLERRFGDVDTWVNRAAVGAMRKAWNEVVRWEREHRGPMGRCGAASAAAAGVTFGLRAGALASHDTPSMGPGEPGDRADAGQPAVEATATDRTMEIMSDRLDLVLACRTDAPGWAADYDAYIAAAPLGSYLSATDFADIVRNWRGHD